MTTSRVDTGRRTARYDPAVQSHPNGDVGAVLRAARLAAGVTLAGMAARTCYSKPYLGQLETGVRTVREEHVAAYQTALGVRIGATTAASVLDELAPLLQAVFVHSADDSPAPDDAEALVRWARAHQWDDAPTAREVVTAWLARHRDRLDTASARVYLAAAELADIASAMAWDVEDIAAAHHYGILAARWAHAAGDDALAAAVLASLAYQYLDRNRASEALELTRFAQYAARHSLGPALHAALATREAWAQLVLGDERAFRRLTAFAEDCRQEPDPIDAIHVPAGRSLRAAELACLIGPRRRVPGPADLHRVVGAGYRGLDCGRPQVLHRAQDHVGRSLRASTSGRDQVFEMVTLARVQLLLDEPEQAAGLITTAAPQAEPWVAGRIGSRLRDFRHESARFASVPAIREANDAIGALMHR